MKKKALALFLTAMMAVSMLAGCGGKSSSSNSTAKEEVKEEAKEQAEKAEEKVEEAADDAKEAVEEAEEVAPIEVTGEVAAQAPAEEADEIYDAASAEREEADMEPGMLYESAQLANPFTDTDTLEEAQEIAGFEMEVPAAVSPYTAVSYRAIEGEMLEVIFSDRKGEEGYRIRKAAGEDDISGDYNEYAKEKMVRLTNGTKVTLRGDKEDAWSVAVWTKDAEDEKGAYSFAICSGEKTFTSDQIKKMAETMMHS